MGAGARKFRSATFQQAERGDSERNFRAESGRNTLGSIPGVGLSGFLVLLFAFGLALLPVCTFLSNVLL